MRACYFKILAASKKFFLEILTRAGEFWILESGRRKRKAQKRWDSAERGSGSSLDIDLEFWLSPHPGL